KRFGFDGQGKILIHICLASVVNPGLRLAAQKVFNWLWLSRIPLHSLGNTLASLGIQKRKKYSRKFRRYSYEEHAMGFCISAGHFLLRPAARSTTTQLPAPEYAPNFS